jgi:Lon protease-like protein
MRLISKQNPPLICAIIGEFGVAFWKFGNSTVAQLELEFKMNSRPPIIPLFPLEKVLFPRMAMPLHVFEERYKTMVEECIAEDKLFGVLHGLDVQRPAVGTTARIEKVLNRYDDGRLDVLIVGEQRFQVHSVLQNKAYLQAIVSYFNDHVSEQPDLYHLSELVRLYKLYVQRIGVEKNNKLEMDVMVEEMEQESELSYVIGQTIGLDLRSQQELLEKTDPLARVKLLTVVLQRHDVVHGLARDLFEGPKEFDPTMN